GWRKDGALVDAPSDDQPVKTREKAMARVVARRDLTTRPFISIQLNGFIGSSLALDLIIHFMRQPLQATPGSAEGSARTRQAPPEIRRGRARIATPHIRHRLRRRASARRATSPHPPEIANPMRCRSVTLAP